jgi:murein DD-endopeptidase MepM/ murein hydrolase activator NlpD
MKIPRSHVVLAFCLFLFFILVFSFISTKNSQDQNSVEGNDHFNTESAAVSEKTSEVEDEPLSPSSKVIQQPEEPYVFQIIEGKIRRGEGFDDSLKRSKIRGDIRRQLIQAFSGTLDFRDLKPKDRYSVSLDSEGKLISCTYESSPLNIHRVFKSGGEYVAEKTLIPLEVRTERLDGVIVSSMFETMVELGEEAKLIYGFVSIFSSRIDFNSETQPGDRFSLVFEKYFKDDEFVGYGRILIARYEQAKKSWEGFYYSSENTAPGHFDQEGEELGTLFLRSPIPFGRVTSRFSYRRRHPVLKVVRPHLGVDLAAPTGTPVMAASGGKIVFRGWKGDYGNQVVIKHANGYKTYYGHLSKFKKGQKVGHEVKQKDIIGYVGSTGLSTGPHLDYRISHEGVFRNPFSIEFKPKTVLTGEERVSFSKERKRLARLMDFPVDQRVLYVRQVVLGRDKDIAFL